MSTPRFNDTTTGDEVVAQFKDRLQGLTVLVTGVAHTGIGGSTAVTLARGGAGTLILAARSEARASETLAAVRAANPATNVVFIALDLGSQASVRAAARAVLENPAIKHIDALVHNAGMLAPVKGPVITEDGVEQTFAVCHIGHWLLTSLLLPRLLAAPEPRVVNVSSTGHAFFDGVFDDYAFAATPFEANIAYGRAKAANIVFTRGLVEKFGDRLRSYAVQPGWVSTELTRSWTQEELISAMDAGAKAGLEYGSKPKSLEQGCSTTLVALLDPAIPNGVYLDDCKPKQPYKTVDDPTLVAKLWEVSEKIVGQKFA